MDFAGEYVYGKDKKVCAIFQQGSTLIVINERGDAAIGRVTGKYTFVIVKGIAADVRLPQVPTALGGWDAGLKATLTLDGKELIWDNSCMWERVA